MPESITSLLADRLEISEDRARSLLETMLQELRQRAESEGVRLPELGTFREEDGRLTFEPSPSLQRRVNVQYEGLSTEGLSAPSEAPELAVPELDEEEESSDSPDDEPTPAATPTEKEETTVDEEPSDREPVSASEAEASREGRTFDSFTIITLVLALLFAGGAGWFVLNRTNVLTPDAGSSPELATEQSSPPPDTTLPSDTTSTDQPDRSPGDETDEEDAAPSTEKNWAIVVGSHSSRSAAEATAKQYRAQFDSVVVVPGTVNDQTWYRVAIGWYSSEEAAERALDEQASALPSGAWTHSLR